MTKYSIVSIISILLVSTAVSAGKSEVYSPLLGNAIGGYDPITYFIQGKAVKGSAGNAIEYRGATWHFESAENKALFQRNPEKYAPQYGGYCAYALSQGNLVSSDPHVWSIVNGKLYLNYSKDVRDIWKKDIPGYIGKADGNWPGILE